MSELQHAGVWLNVDVQTVRADSVFGGRSKEADLASTGPDAGAVVASLGGDFDFVAGVDCCEFKSPTKVDNAAAEMFERQDRVDGQLPGAVDDRSAATADPA